MRTATLMCQGNCLWNFGTDVLYSYMCEPRVTGNDVKVNLACLISEDAVRNCVLGIARDEMIMARALHLTKSQVCHTKDNSFAQPFCFLVRLQPSQKKNVKCERSKTHIFTTWWTWPNSSVLEEL